VDFRQLQALLAVSEHGSFSAAAKALYTVQSNVSAHVARLERDLGVELIDRAKGELTADGKLVARRARRVMAELDSVPNDLVASRGEIAGELRVGAIGTTARWLLPQLLPEMRRRHPSVHMTVVEASTTTLVSQLVDGHLELAVLNLPLDNVELQASLLFEEDLMLITPIDHPLALLTSATIADAAPYDMLMPPKGTALRREIDAGALRADVALRSVAEIDGGRLLTSLALEGLGLAIVPATAVPGWVKGAFARIPMSGLPARRVGLASRRRSTLSGPGRAFTAALADILSDKAPLQPGVRPHHAALAVQSTSP
jgi:DNA-binding transcriptional LysR family regulator